MLKITKQKTKSKIERIDDMENAIEQYVDSFGLYLADNLYKQVPVTQLYNNWVRTEPSTPSMDAGLKFMEIATSLLKQEKLKKEYLLQILSN